MKIKKIAKISLKVLIVLLLLVAIFTLVTFIIHKIKTKKEIELLKEKGYYNLVSVGDYSLNVAIFGNENGKFNSIEELKNQLETDILNLRKDEV